MIAILVGAGTFLYVLVSFAFARCAYWSEYNKIYGSPAPMVYGGKNGHDVAHKYAMREARFDFFLWPIICLWRVMYLAGDIFLWPIICLWRVMYLDRDIFTGFVSSGIGQSWVEQDNELRKLEEETDQLWSEVRTMTNYVDLDDLRSRVYFQSATLDDRYVFEETEPVQADDGRTYRQYRLVDCAHREADRDGALCTHCGHEDPYEPPAHTAVRKTRARRAEK